MREILADLVAEQQALDQMQKRQPPSEEQRSESDVSRDYELDNVLTAVVTAALDDIQKTKDQITQLGRQIFRISSNYAELSPEQLREFSNLVPNHKLMATESVIHAQIAEFYKASVTYIELLRGINEAGTTVILTTHYLEEAEQLCRNIAIIDHGEIIQDTNMKSLLATLDIETFVLDLREPISECPCVDGMEIELIDENTIEASLPKAKSLNNLFAELDQKGVHVLSMRNKDNRLEELFLRLVDKGEIKGEQGA